MSDGDRTGGLAVTTTRTTAPDGHVGRAERTVLGNGLRIVALPGPPSAAVALVLDYDVGIRAERPGRSGFAHLFEHLVFQGTKRVSRRAFSHAVESAGGSFNGSTVTDFTSYHVVMPATGLDRAMFLLADQMGGPLLAESALANQIAVVKEEVLTKILNRPLGGFPTFQMPAALFSTFANAHNGFGEFDDLDAATLADAAEFFHTFYAPANAVLCVAGADPDRVFALAERYFAAVPGRPAPPPLRLDEPEPTTPRRVEIRDARSPVDAVGISWRVPDPCDLTAFLPFVLLADLLGEGTAARLHHELVASTGIALQVGCGAGLLGGPLLTRHPSAFTVDALVAPDSATDDVVALVARELDRIAADGCQPGELDRIVAWANLKNLSEIGSPLERAYTGAGHELVHARAELGTELPGLLAGVSDEDVRVAAARLASSPSATVVIAGERT